MEKKKVYDVQLMGDMHTHLNENTTFYTTDTDAWLVFNVTDQAFVPTKATITLVNMTDKSVINESMEISVKEASYTIPKNVIEHAGSWVVQVIFEYAGKDYTVPAVRVPVTGHILDGKEPRLFAVESFENLMKSLEAMKDSLAEEVGDVQASIDDIRADLQSRADTLIDEQGTRLSDLYTEKDAALSGLVTQYAEKAETLEADYATELARLGQSDLSLAAQLTPTEHEMKTE